jgi:putative SOS response-associated peptidase YedK
MTMTTIYIDMSEQFTDEELVIEIQKRGYVVINNTDYEEYKAWLDKEEAEEYDLMRIYEALYLGKQEEALRRTREYVSGKVGRELV